MPGPAPFPRGTGEHGPRCPECRSGDLYTIEVARRAGGIWRGVYCAGEYDRGRRRFLSRSCGYASGGADATVRGAAAGGPGGPAERSV